MAGRNTSMRLPPVRLAWRMAISASSSMSRRAGMHLLIVERDADRGEQRDLPVGEAHRRRQRAAHGIGERDDMVGVRLGNENDRECVAGDARQRVLRLQQARQAMRHGEQNAVAHGDADLLVDLLEAVDVDDEDRRAHVLFHAREDQRGLQPVEEQFAVRQAGQIVVHGVVQQPLLGVALVGDVDRACRRRGSPRRPARRRAAPAAGSRDNARPRRAGGIPD